MNEEPVWTDLRSFNGKPWRGSVDIVTAGYPCQPFSVAGKQKGKDAHATSGQMCSGLCGRYAQRSVSLKTFPDIYDWGLNKPMMAYQDCVTALRRACSQCRKSVALTKASTSSSWRIVKAITDQGGSLKFENADQRIQAGSHLWPTVTAQDSKNNAGPSQFARNTKPLNVEAVCHSHPDPRAIGTESLPVLNSQFVEWLMGWPIGWTAFAPVETMSSHWLPHALECLFGCDAYITKVILRTV